MEKLKLKEEDFQNALIEMVQKLCYAGMTLCEDNNKWSHINKMYIMIRDAEELLKYIEQYNLNCL